MLINNEKARLSRAFLMIRQRSLVGIVITKRKTREENTHDNIE